LLLQKVLRLALRRPVIIDPELPVAITVDLAFRVALGMARGLIRTRRAVVLGRGARVTGLSLFRVGGGLVRLDDYAHVECMSRDGVYFGRNFKLGAFSRVIASGSISSLGKGIKIGDNVGIGEFAYIGGAGGVEIGSDTIIGQYFSVHPENHVFTDPTRLFREQGVSRSGIKIGANCWIGAKVTILDGVTIGANSVIAAGSVVTNSFPAHTLIGGVPARLLRNLNSREIHP
jgi:acetyltransferase-like isoleucine patch superfamily enzyme